MSHQAQNTEKERNSLVTEEVHTHLPDLEIKQIVDAVRAQDSDTVHTALKNLSPADTAELLSKITEEDSLNT